MLFRFSSLESTVSTAAVVATASLAASNADAKQVTAEEPITLHKVGVEEDSAAEPEEISQSVLTNGKTLSSEKSDTNDIDIGVLHNGVAGGHDGAHPSRFLTYDCSNDCGSRPQLPADADLEAIISACEDAGFDEMNSACYYSKIGCFDTSLVTDMVFAFSASSFSGDLNCWDTSSVTDMRGMFLSAADFNGDISGWDTSSVVDMSRMFYGATSFNQNLDEWDVSGVFYLERMFQDAAGFNQCLSTWQRYVPNYVNTFQMFTGSSCSEQPENPVRLGGVPWCQSVDECYPIGTTRVPTVSPSAFPTTSAPSATAAPVAASSSSKSSKSSKSTKSSKSSKKSKSSSSSDSTTKSPTESP